MDKYIELERLGEENAGVGSVECFMQIWEDGSRYCDYSDCPRRHSGIIFPVSDIEAHYHFPDGRTLDIKKGILLYIPAGVNYTVSFDGGGKSEVDIYTINFDLSDNRGDRLLTDGVRIVNGIDEKLLLFHAERLYNATMEIPCNYLHINAAVLTLLSEVARICIQQEKGFYPIRAGVALLRQEWDRSEKISRYAEKCGLSESRFYLLFHEWAGTSPTEYRTKMRMSRAASLLCNSSLSVREIAERVGYEDQFYFSRVFRREMGVPPLAFRIVGMKNN